MKTLKQEMQRVASALGVPLREVKELVVAGVLVYGSRRERKANPELGLRFADGMTLERGRAALRALRRIEGKVLIEWDSGKWLEVEMPMINSSTISGTIVSSATATILSRG